MIKNTRLEVQVPYMAHLLGIASLVLGDISDPDLSLDQGVNRLSGP